MNRKSKLFHLLVRLSFFLLPELVLLLLYVFRGQHIDSQGVPHKTDAALGFAIYSILLCLLWVVIIIIDTVLLFIRKRNKFAMLNISMLSVLVFAGLVIWGILRR